MNLVLCISILWKILWKHSSHLFASLFCIIQEQSICFHDSYLICQSFMFNIVLLRCFLISAFTILTCYKNANSITVIHYRYLYRFIYMDLILCFLLCCLFQYTWCSWIGFLFCFIEKWCIICEKNCMILCIWGWTFFIRF